MQTEYPRKTKKMMSERLTTEQYWPRKVSMTVSSAEVLSSHLKPLCSRDNHVMKYEPGGSRSNAENQASYHCGFEGCSVRYDSTDGYYMLIGMPDHPNPVDEPGVNTAKCPRHGHWLYRRENIDPQPGVVWSCGLEGCDYRYDASKKGAWVRS
jgi:hypothetical protein